MICLCCQDIFIIPQAPAHLLLAFSSRKNLSYKIGAQAPESKIPARAAIITYINHINKLPHYFLKE